MRRHAAMVAVLIVAGCQPATHYEKPSEKTADATKAPTHEPTRPPAADPTLAWMDSRPKTVQPAVPIEFVHESDGDEWAKLPRFWNAPPTDAERAAAALALGPLTAVVPLAETKPVIKIKVPAGLDDPRPHIPQSNPPTLDKWELGRRLFYDRAVLGDEGGASCATCHDPSSGFADNDLGHYGVNTPTLVNCVFNRRQFWDGRVAVLEEVVARTSEDETAPPAEGPPFRHVWGGVVRRLRSSTGYTQLFLNAFGTPPTQDAVGKALATYMRTLLAGDSLHDRARHAQAAEHAPQFTASHYEKILDDAALKKLGLEGKPKADAAKQVYEGYRLFHDVDRTGCVRCHGGGEFTDGGFHNLGVGWKGPPDLDRPPGRFGSLPLGEKDRTMIGAYKTPTLRGLLRTWPYFHDGSAATPEEAVRFHLKGGEKNEYLDAAMLDPRDWERQRTSDLAPQEVSALVLFLRALDGEDVDAAVLPPAPR